jgi:formate dehydrogenase subunit gamma
MSSDLFNLAKIIDALKHKKGALLPILHEIQKEVGYIPLESIDIIAQKLHQTPAEIHGVISFYHQFRTAPSGANKIQICRSEACQARGCRDLEDYAKEKLGIDYHETTADKKFSLDSVYCLGNCATGPNVRINDELYGRVNNEKFDGLLTTFKTQAEG